MKQDTHPEYREVVFMDTQTGDKVIIRSTVNTRDTHEGLPLYKCDVTSKSHPFYTGAQTRIVETDRVGKFLARFAHVIDTNKAEADKVGTDKVGTDKVKANKAAAAA